MIRNQLAPGTQQQQQHHQTFQATRNQTAPGGNAASGVGTPAVDLSHLTAEERAMIQSVMAKAEMVDGNLTGNSLGPNRMEPNTLTGASQAMNFQQQQQQLAALQNQQLQQIYRSNLNCQPIMQPQQSQMMTGGGGQQNRFNLAAGNLNCGPTTGPNLLPNNLSSQNPQQPQQSIAFQHQQPLKGQLPSLEQRTQELVSQINSQFNLGGASSSSNWQNNSNSQTQRPMATNPQPAGCDPTSMTIANRATDQQQINAFPPQMQRQQQQQQQQQQHQGVPMAIGPLQNPMAAQNLVQLNRPQNVFDPNVASEHQQTFSNQQMAPIGQVMFDLQGQQTLVSQQNRAIHQNLQRANSMQTNQMTVVPNQSLLDGRFISTFDAQNQILFQKPQQQLCYGPQGYGPVNFEPNFMMGSQMQPNLDERQNIKFGRDFERGYARSDQEDRVDQDRHSRASRKSRAHQWARLKSAETMPNELEYERSARWRHEAAHETTCRRLPKPGQAAASQAQESRMNDHQRSLAATDRSLGRDKSHPSNRSRHSNRYSSGHGLHSSHSSLSDEELSSASSSARDLKNERVNNKPTERLSKSFKLNNDNECRTRPEENVDANNKTSQLMSELKLNEQASQVMEQQQLLIRQSQELIKLQQAQLERQAKRTEDETRNAPPAATPTNDLTATTATTAATKLDGKSAGIEPSKPAQAMRDELGISGEVRDDQITDSSNDLEQLVRGKRSRASTTNSKYSHHGECLLDSPTNTSDSDSELLSCSLRRHRPQRHRLSTPTSRGRAPKGLSKQLLVATNLTPSPLPVEAAIQLHQLQTLCTSGDKPSRGRDKALKSQRPTRSRIELLRSRSVCNSPQSLLLGRTRQSSPDAMSEFSQRMAQRKLLPDPPTNAVPLTPSMVRKMVETQRVAATSSSKLPTRVNAQSTLLTNTHSIRQPCLDEGPSTAYPLGHSIGYQCDQRSSKPAPRPLGSYTARISGAQVSFAPCERSLVSAAAARHQKLGALSRADLSKFLDFTYGTSILKSSNQPQQQPSNRQFGSSDWLRRQDERYRHSSGRLHGTNSTLSQSLGRERSLFETPSLLDRHSDSSSRDELFGRSVLTSRRRRSSEGDSDAGYLSYRSRLPTSKHVNFRQNYHKPAVGQTIDRSSRASNLLPTPRLPRQGLFSNPTSRHDSGGSQCYEWSSHQDRESRLARFRTQASSIDCSYPDYRFEWSPRSSWAANTSSNQSDGLCNRYVQARSTDSDYESRLTSKLDGRNLSGLNRSYMRYPYKQRSFDTN